MKSYKRTYCASLPYFVIRLFITGVPCAVFHDVFLLINGHEKSEVGILILLLVTLLFLGISMLFMLLATVLINCFKDPSVWLDESTISHNGIPLLWIPYNT